MTLKKTMWCLGPIMLLALLTSVPFGANAEAAEAEKQEYKQERARIKTLRDSLKPGPTNDLKEYEKFADELHGKWNKRNKEHFADLMLEICKPLSSGRFNDRRRYDVARRYALAALGEPNEIALEVELELTGHVMTPMITHRAPKGQEWLQKRRADVRIRLHAWKRLTDSIDPNWDPNDMPSLNVPLPPGVDGVSGMSPEAIRDPRLRAEYEAAVEENRQKAERYREQYRWRKWLRWFPAWTERDIIRAYSKPPFNLEELKKYLDQYIVDKKIKGRILGAVQKNMEIQTKELETSDAQ